jgi:hypothetical protein
MNTYLGYILPLTNVHASPSNFGVAYKQFGLVGAEAVRKRVLARSDPLRRLGNNTSVHKACMTVPKLLLSGCNSCVRIEQFAIASQVERSLGVSPEVCTVG